VIAERVIDLRRSPVQAPMNQLAIVSPGASCRGLGGDRGLAGKNAAADFRPVFLGSFSFSFASLPGLGAK
jgi:hypothetical protein